jgi:arsenite methyltransferase
VAAYVGCIAGAILIEDYRGGLIEAGLSHVQVVDGGADLNAYAMGGNSSCCGGSAEAEAAEETEASCCGPGAAPKAGGCGCGASQESDADGVHAGLADVLRRYDVNEYAASVKVYAVKPKRANG